MVRAVTRHIAEFHARAEPAPPGCFDPEGVAARVGEIFRTPLPYARSSAGGSCGPPTGFTVVHPHGDLLEART